MSSWSATILSDEGVKKPPMLAVLSVRSKSAFGFSRVITVTILVADLIVITTMN